MARTMTKTVRSKVTMRNMRTTVKKRRKDRRLNMMSPTTETTRKISGTIDRRALEIIGAGNEADAAITALIAWASAAEASVSHPAVNEDDSCK